ncbi:hypothetical protein ACFE04_004226 [Oxalis oulophora]
MAEKVKVVDEYRVAPPPGSLPATLSLPLTLFDLRLLYTTHNNTMKGVFFYPYPQTVHYFIETTIPSLKSSLSLALQYFYPFVSDLIIPPSPQKPYILFTEGNSVSFTVAQYSGEFDHFINDKIKDVKDLQHLAPVLPPARVSPDGTCVKSLLAVQVTLFPGQGISIGIGSSHAVADGRSTHQFVKSWAWFCKSNNVIEIDKFQMPSFNRDYSVNVPQELESKLFQKWHEECHYSYRRPETSQLYADKVRSTFVVKRTHIEKLKQHISNNISTSDIHLSSLVVTSSLVWICFIKSLETRSDEDNDNVCHLNVPVDLRTRISAIPSTYFGNCIAGLYIGVKRNELVGHEGLIAAAKAIGQSIKELRTIDGVLRAIENYVNRVLQNSFGTALLFLVAGSPKFDVYNKDFGWGLPNKAEVLQLGSGNCMTLAECRNDEGGIEIALELKTAEMDAFTQHFYQILDEL